MFFLRATLLDTYQSGRPKGSCNVDFASKDGAVATMESVAQKPIRVRGSNLNVEFSLGNTRKPVTEPYEKLYFSGCTGDESKIRTIFQQFSDSIVRIYLCMFTLSDSVPTTHMESH